MKYNVLFSLRSSAKRDKPIRMRVAYSGTRFEYAVGYAVPPENWDEQKQRVKRATKNGAKQDSLEINNKIVLFESIVSQIFAEYEVQKKRVPTLAELKENFERNVGATHRGERDVQSYLQEFIEEQTILKNWTTNTIKSFKMFAMRMQEFDDKLYLNEINEELICKLYSFFRNKEYRESTTQKMMRLMKWFLRWCFKKHYVESNESFGSITTNQNIPEKEVIYLEKDELMQLYNYNFNNIPLNNARDVFCFCCFTGLRYSDAAKLKKTDVHKGVISVVTQKTRATLSIELNRYSSEILEKHKDIMYKNGLALPVFTLCYYNTLIRKMCKIAGLNSTQKITTMIGSRRVEQEFKKWQIVSSHSGRKTFVVNALRLGIPAEVIMKWTGHKNFQAMKPYIQIVDSLKQQEMTKFNDFL